MSGTSLVLHTEPRKDSKSARNRSDGCSPFCRKSSTMQEKGKKRATRETTDEWPVPHPKMCFILNAIGGHEADRRASDRLVLTRAHVGQDDPNFEACGNEASH